MRNSTSPVFDLHCDAVLKLVHRNAKFQNNNVVSHVDIPKMRKGNVNGLIYSFEMISVLGKTGGIFGLAFFPAFFPNQDEAETKIWMETIIKKLNEGGAGSTLDEKAQNNAAVFMDTPPPAVVADLSGILPHMDHVIDLIGEDHVGIGTDFDGIPFGPVGLENCSKFDNLRQLMQQHGYSDQKIYKILGGNVRRVLRDILP